MPKRQKISQALREEVLQFYGGVCVLTNAVTLAIDLHHLDDNHANSVFANLIPLSGELNGAIDRIKHGRHAPHPLLQPEAIESEARRRYDNNKFQQAYACNRLGAFLCASQYNQPDLALRFSARALLSLRAINNVELAEDTIRRTVIPILADARKLDLPDWEGKALLALELGSYFRDYGLLREAGAWLKICEGLINHASRNSTLAKEIKFRKYQHAMFVAMAMGDAVAADYWMRRQAETGYSYTFGETNNLFWLAQFRYNQGRLDESLDALRKVEKYGPLFTKSPEGSAGRVPTRINGWTYGQSKVLLGDIYQKLGDNRNKRLAMEIGIEAVAHFRESRIVPMRVFHSPLLKKIEERMLPQLRLRQRDPRRLGQIRILSRDVAHYLRMDQLG